MAPVVGEGRKFRPWRGFAGWQVGTRPMQGIAGFDPHQTGNRPEMFLVGPARPVLSSTFASQ